MKPEVYKKLCRAKEFMDERCCSPIDLDSIARQANLSVYHFLRVFSKVYCKTPHRYLTLKRIDKAKEYLALENHSITDICFDIGFESPGSFSSMFLKHTGLTPTEFRNSARRKIYMSVSFPEKLIPACYLFSK